MMCKDCFAGRKKKPGKYIQKMLLFIELKKAGYPVKANDLTVDEWLDFNRIDNELINIFKRKK